MKAKYTPLTLKITVVTPVHINSGNILFEDRDFYLSENRFIVSIIRICLPDFRKRTPINCYCKSGIRDSLAFAKTEKIQETGNRRRLETDPTRQSRNGGTRRRKNYRRRERNRALAGSGRTLPTSYRFSTGRDEQQNPGNGYR